MKDREITHAALDAAIANAALEGLRPDEEALADLELLAGGRTHW